MMPGHSSARHWQLEIDDEKTAWLCLDRHDSAANTLSTDVMEELDRLLAGIEAEPPAGLVLFSGKPDSFVAGADIHEFPGLVASDQLASLTRKGQQILARIEQLPCPSVAVLNGHALGGGLELALACRWRIALQGEERTIGLPEVQLGLHPGFGGTVRAIQRAGVRAGLKLILTGKPVTPARARQIGLVDRLLQPGEDWRAAACRQLAVAGSPRPMGLLDRLLNLAPVRPRVARRLAREAEARAPGEHYPAPGAILDLWTRHGGAPVPAAFEDEAQSFARLAATPASANLVRVFFLQERLKKLARPAAQIHRIHVVGAGVMGGDIAAWCALRGLEVSLQDRDPALVEKAVARAARLFDRRLGSAGSREAARGRLRADPGGEAVGQADLVIEAIYEDLRAKQGLYESLEAAMRPDAVLASNTSSIPLEQLAAGLQQPGRLVGLHFFNPVASLPLVEVVLAGQSTTAARELATAFVRQIGKLPLPCRSQPGFLVNRILAPYMAEAMELAREGVPMAEIDQAAVSFGMPMGPIALADSVGLDVALHVARILAPVIGRPVAPELEALVEAGHLGVKTGRGFYTYQDGKPVRPPGDESRPDEEVQDRLILSLLNEAAACLHEGVVEDADLIDAGVIFGTGFAPFRGGPMHHALAVGVAQITRRLDELTAAHGLRFRPSRGWEQLGLPGHGR
ncbi:MAG: enoyl-CoA hydratase/isomerase family protein [Chromatiales bacterium]|nr:enoyl-CoA hydratase/isomerase family protein [Chromatiales bacterium]